MPSLTEIITCIKERISTYEPPKVPQKKDFNTIILTEHIPRIIETINNLTIEKIINDSLALYYNDQQFEHKFKYIIYKFNFYLGFDDIKLFDMYMSIINDLVRNKLDLTDFQVNIEYTQDDPDCDKGFITLTVA
jgi:hypothetical protein